MSDLDALILKRRETNSYRNSNVQLKSNEEQSLPFKMEFNQPRERPAVKHLFEADLKTEIVEQPARN